MSNKTKKKNRKVQKKTNKALWYSIVIAELILVVLLIVLFVNKKDPTKDLNVSDTQQDTSSITDETSTDTATSALDSESDVAMNPELPAYLLSAGHDLGITAITSYSGPYYEDGSDEEVSGVMMIQVTNYGEGPVQYAEITLSGEAGDALFKLTTLFPGESMNVLEANRKTYTEGDQYTSATSSNVAYFQQEISLHEDVLKVQALDGGFNISNISEEDITGDIVVYFKNQADRELMGGITYRGTIEGGLKSGEIRQVMSSKFTASGTRVMFITIAE